MSTIHFRRYIIKKARQSGLMPIINSISNFRFLLVKKYCLLRKKNCIEYIYNDNFFKIVNRKYILKDSPKIIAEVVKACYAPKSVMDVGCGSGLYLRELNKLGIEIFGVDGSAAALRNLVIDKNKFLLQDVTCNFVLPRRYDCVICFEVGEHIPTVKSDILVDNIIKISDLVIFAAASKGQGGRDHINEQSAQFWVDIFDKKGYSLLAEDTKKIRATLSDREAAFWLIENILVFKRRAG
ncbi:MAG: class I SAM-dependent methyltransferase [Patescibacteria group bacterium]|nr:class I SAM-dependent methyltransferase [Patescibacteria group bacterium]